MFVSKARRVIIKLSSQAYCKHEIRRSPQNINSAYHEKRISKIGAGNRVLAIVKSIIYIMGGVNRSMQKYRLTTRGGDW